jgi:hypothetical protein
MARRPGAEANDLPLRHRDRCFRVKIQAAQVSRCSQIHKWIHLENFDYNAREVKGFIGWVRCISSLEVISHDDRNAAMPV